MAEAVADNVPAKATPIDGKPPLFGLSFLENLSEMTMLRQVGLLVGLAASVAIGFAVVLWSQQPDYRPLYGSLAGMDAKQVMDTLASADIPYTVEPNSGALLVKADDLSRARLKLAAAGVTPSDGNIGFEILDKDQGLGTLSSRPRRRTGSHHFQPEQRQGCPRAPGDSEKLGVRA
jgi:flagellar M-ring protein FliF